VRWAVRGPAGATGARGATGPQGAQGPPGQVDTSTSYTKADSDQRFVQTAASGRALAGVRVGSDGSILSWFNSAGGKPTITHTSPSRAYFVSFPGFTFDATKLVLATPEPHTTFPGFGSEEIVVTPVTSGDLAGTEQVTAFDQETTGGTAGEPFSLLVYGGTAGQ